MYLILTMCFNGHQVPSCMQKRLFVQCTAFTDGPETSSQYVPCVCSVE